MIARDVLTKLPYLAGLPDTELDRLAAISHIFEVKEGDVVIEQGAPPGDLLVIVDGRFLAVRKGPVSDIVFGDSGVGEVLGEISLLEDRPTSAEVTALTSGTLLRVPGNEIQNLLASPPMANQMLRTVTSRLRERETALVQAEKLAALGTLTAGLLHEVNNPAAALIRAGTGLDEATRRLTPDLPVIPLTSLQKSDRTRALAAILTESGTDPALAGSLVSQGWDEERLRSVPASEHGRIADLAHVRQLASEVVLAASRVSELVGTVKRWTFHDQGGGSQTVDLVTVIEDSLTLLRHKTTGVEVVTDIPESVMIEGRGGELSQVVTNLIDNAVDAPASRIAISLTADPDQATITIEDNGPGIPQEVVDRVWEPFFTTKAPGKGTGLGLAVSHRIVTDHGGSLQVESEPGRTRFTVSLPKSG